MYMLNIARVKKRMSINEMRDFTFENCYERIGFIGFPKENSYYSMKYLKK